MNNGVLQFSLGLATGGFIRPLSGAMGELKGFIAGAVGFGAVMAGVKDAIERGSNLEHLHQQTGESVKDLYALQEAFKAVGVDAQQLPMMLLRMQQALSGFGRGAGNQTLFGRVGLDIAKLKQMDAPAQIDAIAQALSKVDRQTATGVVAQLFGIETGAVPFLQVIGSSKEFHQILQQVAADAQETARSAKAFSELDSSFVVMKSHVSAMFAGLASGLIPALDTFSEKVKSLNASGFGEGIGKGIRALTNAFSSGHMSELIALSIQTGFETAWPVELAAVERLGVVLLEAFKTPLEYLQAGLTWMEEEMLQWISDLESHLPKRIQKAIGFNTGLTGFKADSFAQIFADEKKRGVQFDLGTGAFGFADMDKNASANRDAAIARLKRLSAPLLAMIDGLAGKAPQIESGSKSVGKSNLGAGQNEYKPQYTTLEKMGFVLGGNPMADFARRTADNTSRIASLVAQTNALLGGGGGTPTTQVDLT